MTKNKINILQVVAGMNRGGAETFLMNVLRTIDRDRYNFVFLCYGDKPFAYEDEIVELGAKIIRIPEVKHSGIVGHVKNLREIIKTENIHVIHAHTYFNSMFSLLAGRLQRVPVRIAHSHNTKSEDAPSLLKRIYFSISKMVISKYATAYLACGEAAGRALFGKKKFEIIKNGILIKNFKFDMRKRDKLRKDVGLGEGSEVLMHIGRFEDQKNHKFLIDIFSVYLKDRPNSKLVLIGEGPLRVDIEQKAKALGIYESVLFLGVRADVSDLYNVADLFVFPSLFEGLPVVLIESQANGLASVVSSSVDSGVKITDTVNFMSLDDSINEWVNKIKAINRTHTDTTQDMQNSGYAVESVLPSLIEVYESSRS